MVNQVRVSTDIELRGALVMGVDNSDFPANPRLGQLVLKGSVLYGYQNIGGFLTWYPLTQASKSYLHTQGLAALEWTVQHNLGTDVQWFQVLDTSGNPIYCSRTEVTANSFKLNFTEAAEGTCIVVVPDDINVPSIQASIVTAGSIDVGSGTVLIGSDGISVSGSKVLTVSDLGSGTLFVTQAQMDARIQQVVGTAPAALDTLGEIATQLANDESATAALVSAIALKADTSSLAKVATSGSYLDLANVPASFTPPVATAAVLGGVKAGSGVTIAADGTLSVATYSYTLPAATASTLGGIKVGSGLSVAADGTLSANVLSVTNVTVWTNTPYDLGFPVFSKPKASEQVFRFVAARAYKLPADQTNGRALAQTAATASAVFTITKNGTQIGTVTFAAGSTTGTISISADVSFAVGDRIMVVAPSTVDSTLADIDFTFVCVLA